MQYNEINEKSGMTMYDIIIVGAGPAGLTSALYALRANKKVLLLEAKSYGGQIINAHRIENYPGISAISGFDYATTLYNQVLSLGGMIRYERVQEVLKDKTVITNKGTYQVKSIIIATGCERRKLNIEREEEFVGHGISYCATCDGAFFKDLDVAVVGGGNTALEEALYLANLARKVYLIHRCNTFKAQDAYIEEVHKKDNIELILNAEVETLKGSDKLESVTIRHDGTLEDLAVSGLFIAIGLTPNNTAFENILKLDSDGYIVSANGETNCEGIYVAGDARTKDVRQLTTAVADGTIAATLAMTYLNNLKDE